MVLVSSVWHIFSSALIFLIGVVIAIKTANSFNVSHKRAIILYFWHSILCLVGIDYVFSYGGDALGYYRDSLSSDIEFSLGTHGVTLLTRFFSFVLGLSFLGVSLVFNLFGFIGLLAFDGCLRATTWNKSKNVRFLATLIVFLPSVSFWSSAIGKDGLAFMSTCLSLWAALSLTRRVPLMIFAVTVMLFVRPHIAGAMIIALTLAYLFNANTTLKKRLILTSISAIVAALLLPFVYNFIGLDKLGESESLNAYIEIRQSYNMDGGGGIDISSMSLPEQLFAYMFRPFIFEANSIFSAAAAFDNLILLFLFVAGFWEKMKGKHYGIGENIVFMWVYALMTWFVLAMTTANLGISLRQKWMFAPMLIFLLLSVIGRRKKELAILEPSIVKPDIIPTRHAPDFRQQP
jgi:hypothetical protein